LHRLAVAARIQAWFAGWGPVRNRRAGVVDHLRGAEQPLAWQGAPRVVARVEPADRRHDGCAGARFGRTRLPVCAGGAREGRVASLHGRRHRRGDLRLDPR
jgi:hypothetical protein